MTPPPPDTLLATALPPGWIEIGAFADDSQLRDHLELKFSVSGGFSADQRDLLRAPA